MKREGRGGRKLVRQRNRQATRYTKLSPAVSLHVTHTREVDRERKREREREKVRWTLKLWVMHGEATHGSKEERETRGI